MSHRILISFSVLMAFLVFTPNAPAEQVTHEEYSFVVPESCFPFPEQTHQNFEAKFRQDSVNGFPDAHFVYGHLSSGETRYPATIVVKWYANRRIPDKVLESMPRIKVNEVSGDHDVFPCFPEKQFDDSTSTIWEEKWRTCSYDVPESDPRDAERESPDPVYLGYGRYSRSSRRLSRDGQLRRDCAGVCLQTQIFLSTAPSVCSGCVHLH